MRNTNIIKNAMVDCYRDITRQQRIEVLTYIRIRTDYNKNSLKVLPYVINLENTRIDLQTGKKLEFTPDVIEFDRIPIQYNEHALSFALEGVLMDIFCHDQEVRSLFEEMMGYCLMKHCKYNKAFILYGSGANGKSTILHLLKKMLGCSNYSSIELERLNDRFKTAELEHKLANIGDDINNSLITDTGTLKNLISGNGIMVERKGKQPFDLYPYATHIYSCNELPTYKDKTNGLYRRLVFIPFNAKFSEERENYDPYILDKITDEESMSHLFNMALSGAQRLIKNGKFTEPKNVEITFNQFRIENSSVLSWLNDREHEVGYIVERSCQDLYVEYDLWCRTNGITNIVSSRIMYKEIRERFGLEIVQRRVKGTTTRLRFFSAA